MKSKTIQEKIRFEELFETPLRNGLFRPSSTRGFGIKMVNMKEIFGNNRIGLISMEKVPMNDEEKEKFLLKKGDLLFARQSLVYEGTGKCVIVTNSIEELTFESHIIRVRLNPCLSDPRFYYYYFNSRMGRQTILSIAEQTAASGIRGNDLKQLMVVSYPIEYQKKIADILENIDNLIDNIKTQNRILEQTAQAIFQSWFVDFDGVTEFEDSELGKIPTGWSVEKLTDLCTTQYGYTESASDQKIGPKFLRVTDMNKQPWIDWNKVPYCKITETNFKKYFLKQGDLVVSRMADPGKVGIIEEDVDAVFASYLVRLKAISIEQSYFIFYFIRSKKYLDYAEGISSGGSVQKNMNAKRITDIDFVKPSDEKIKLFFNLIYPIRIKITKSNHQILSLTKTRDLLLPKLMSGEIRV